MQRRLFFILILLAVSSSRVTAGCINPFTLAHSTVGITRYFDDNEKKEARPDVLGIRGTGWFLSPLSMVTVKTCCRGHASIGPELEASRDSKRAEQAVDCRTHPAFREYPCRKDCRARIADRVFQCARVFSSGRTHSFPAHTKELIHRLHRLGCEAKYDHERLAA